MREPHIGKNGWWLHLRRNRQQPRARANRCVVVCRASRNSKGNNKNSKDILPRMPSNMLGCSNAHVNVRRVAVVGGVMDGGGAGSGSGVCLSNISEGAVRSFPGVGSGGLGMLLLTPLEEKNPQDCMCTYARTMELVVSSCVFLYVVRNLIELLVLVERFCSNHLTGKAAHQLREAVWASPKCTIFQFWKCTVDVFTDC